MGGWPTFRCRSDASCFMTMRKSLLTSGSLARRPAAGGGLSGSTSAVAMATSGESA